MTMLNEEARYLYLVVYPFHFPKEYLWGEKYSKSKIKINIIQF